MILNHSFTLDWSKSGKGEHADLGGNVIPSSLGTNLLEVLSKELSHLSDSIGNIDEFSKPLLSKIWFV
jgi:hypothetical protein